MTKFVATGDSYTVHGLYEESPYSWVRYLSEQRKWDEINLAKKGACNSYIYNSSLDAIENHNPDIMITMWSDPFRINFFDIVSQILQSEENLIGWMTKAEAVHDEDDKINLSAHANYVERTSELTHLIVETMKTNIKFDVVKAYVSIVNASLRKFYHIQELCNFKGIEFYHCQSLPTIGGETGLDILLQEFDNPENATVDSIVDEIKETKYYKLLDDSPQWMGYDFIASNHIRKNNMVISELNFHPTDEGHRDLAKIIDKFIYDGIRINNSGEALRPIYVYD